MPRTGATFNLLNNTNYPAVEDEVIDQDGHNAMLEDLAQGLTDSVSRDGAGTMTGDLNMGTNKLTNLAAGSANGHSVRYEQVQLANAFATAWEGASWSAGKMGYATGASSVSLIDTTAAGRAFLNYTDPNADKLVYWKDADGTVASVSLGTGLAFSGGSLSLDADLVTWAGVTPAAGVATFISTPSFANLAAAVTGTWNLPSGSQLNGTAFGTASTKNTGTSGNNVPLLDGANTWSAAQAEANNVAWSLAETGGTIRAALKMDLSNNIEIGNANNNSEYLGASHAFSGAVTNFTIGGVVVATTSDTQTLSNKTLSSPTLSGTVAGTPTWGSAQVFPAGTAIGSASVGLLFNNTATDYLHTIDKDNTGVKFAVNSGARGFRWNISGTDVVSINSSGGLTAAVAVSSETSGTLTSASSNKQVNAAGDITINDGVHAANDRIEVYAGASARSIIQDTGMTLRLDGTSTTGTRSLPARGRASIFFVSNSEAIVSGMGVS